MVRPSHWKVHQALDSKPARQSIAARASAGQPNWTDDQLKAIDTPILVVDGDHDEAIKRPHTEYIAATIPHAGLLILPNASHFAFLPLKGKWLLQRAERNELPQIISWIEGCKPRQVAEILSFDPSRRQSRRALPWLMRILTPRFRMRNCISSARS